ncbi:hypothetical protein AN958_01429 [Leucoagaricus sp. SymC.cos]|nr:hypothetical protein AN958_01429 [Leucoagaricus sp. SymC.cos]
MDEYCTTLISALTPHIPRWTFLKLDLSGQGQLSALFQSLPFVSAVQLKTVEFVSPPDVEREKTMVALIARLPSLERLIWDSRAPPDVTRQLVEFPYRKLIHANLYWSLSWTKMFPVIQRLQNAVTAILWSRLPYGLPNSHVPSWNPDHRVVVQNLAVLHVSTTTPDVLFLIANLEAQNLRVLNIEVNESFGVQDISDCYYKLAIFLGFYDLFHYIGFFRLHVSGVLPAEIVPEILKACQRSFMSSVEIIMDEGDWDKSVERKVRREMANQEDVEMYGEVPFHIIPAGEDGFVRLGWYDPEDVAECLRSFREIPHFELGGFQFNPELNTSDH